MNPLLVPRNPGRTGSIPVCCRAGLILAVVAVLFSSAGCGKPKTNTVSGKVTLNGEPVAGEVTFIGPSKKKTSSPITDGKYKVVDVEAGENQITVATLGAGGPARVGPANMPQGMQGIPGDPMKGMPVPSEGSTGKPPPEKYATPGNGLSFDVKPGSNDYDITLQP
jgi:hypothetical protein